MNDFAPKTCAECGVDFTRSDFDLKDPNGDPLCDDCGVLIEKDAGRVRCDDCGEWTTRPVYLPGMTACTPCALDHVDGLTARGVAA